VGILRGRFFAAFATMARRIGAAFAMLLLVGLALLLVWSVHLHHATAPNADELTTVSLSARAY
jgi:hypothetical protein